MRSPRVSAWAARPWCNSPGTAATDRSGSAAGRGVRYLGWPSFERARTVPTIRAPNGVSSIGRPRSARTSSLPPSYVRRDVARISGRDGFGLGGGDADVAADVLALVRSDVFAFTWFGPRGLATIVFGLPSVEELGRDSPVIGTLGGVIMCTVILSVVAPGVSAAPLSRRYGQWVARTHAPIEGRRSVDPMPSRGRGAH